MKHWDLIPGETVTLTSVSGSEFTGRFRDTVWACFREERGRLRFFRLTEGGNLREDLTNFGLRLSWHISGEDRHKRHWLSEFSVPEAAEQTRAFAAFGAAERANEATS